jgi:adenine deaminase
MKDYFIDGHAPKLKGEALNAIVLAGIKADPRNNQRLKKLWKRYQRDVCNG